VKARQGDTQFTSDDLVAYFTTTTRAIERPKLDADIRFEFASANLTPDAKKNLNQWGAALAGPHLADKKFRLGGHTDDVGPDDYNMQLSWDRATAVKQYLEKQFRIPAKRLESKAFGKQAPVEPGTSEQARAANRRVEFEMQRPQ
jgi:outer membrane protein OmpA-like peptidoglycan-associated protein